MDTLKKKRSKHIRQEDLPLLSSTDQAIVSLAQALSKQIDEEAFRKKYAPAAEVLKLVGAGIFLALSFAAPNAPRALLPFLSEKKEYQAWKRFNIPYLKRTLERLEQEKLVRFQETDTLQMVELTQRGKRKLLKCAFDEMTIKKPSRWDGTWRMISYDIPRNSHTVRAMFRKRLVDWGFFPLHESVFLHAYPCESEVEWLREYLGIRSYVRFFRVSSIENDAQFKEFFGLA